MTQSILHVVGLVTQAFEKLDIDYIVGGSIASSYYGLARSTADVDLLADIHVEHVSQLQAELGWKFYLDIESIANALTENSSFNLIHLESMYKVDVFLPKQRAFDRIQLQDATYEQLSRDPALIAKLAGPENTILAKLEWYRLGNEVSDRQWRDVLEVMTLQYTGLNWVYLDEMAEELGVTDLLARAKAICEP